MSDDPASAAPPASAPSSAQAQPAAEQDGADQQPAAGVPNTEKQDQPSAEAAITQDTPAAEAKAMADAGKEDSDDEGPSPLMMSQIREMLLERGFRPKLDGNGEPRPPVLPSFDADGIVEYLRRNCCRNVVVMAGAGISVSAGIPDFRSPGTGCAIALPMRIHCELPVC